MSTVTKRHGALPWTLAGTITGSVAPLIAFAALVSRCGAEDGPEVPTEIHLGIAAIVVGAIAMALGILGLVRRARGGILAMAILSLVFGLSAAFFGFTVAQDGQRPHHNYRFGGG